MRRNDTAAPLAQSSRLIPDGARSLRFPRRDAGQPLHDSAHALRCNRCGAIFVDGRWRWADMACETIPVVQCPACARIADHMPAGRLLLEGPAVATRGVDLVRIALQEAEHERSEHPLHRVIESVNHSDHCIELTTTDVHLPQLMGEAVRRSHGGELHVDYCKDHQSVRVRWRG